jgi:hypothetical protein
VNVAAVALDWLATLDQAQRVQATFPFDSPERFVWAYVPGPRRGLSLGEMTAVQRDVALGAARAALSDRGAREVESIIALEPILGDIERRNGRAGHERRDPGRYWLAIFGEPAGLGPWSLRLEGHHISINIAVQDGRIVAATPSFLGSNPATVPDGPAAGHRAIDGEETLARAFLATLTASQRQLAIVDPVAPPDILSGTGRRANLGEVPVGIRRDQLEDAQIEAFDCLVRHYLGRMEAETALAAWERVDQAGVDSMTFAWAGSVEPGRGHYYSVVGPTLLIEYDNSQNGANHILSVWRDPANDWGDDVLTAHYAAAHRG